MAFVIDTYISVIFSLYIEFCDLFYVSKIMVVWAYFIVQIMSKHILYFIVLSTGKMVCLTIMKGMQVPKIILWVF